MGQKKTRKSTRSTSTSKAPNRHTTAGRTAETGKTCAEPTKSAGLGRKRSGIGKAGVLVALLRGINVGGHKKVPMAELRTLAEGLGCERVASYIQSGNLVVKTTLKARTFEQALQDAVANHFGFSVEVVVRTAREWQGYAAGSPFADAERERPHLLHLGVAKRKLKADCLVTLHPYAKHEVVHALGDAFWIDFVDGVARSKLTPAVLDRSAGSPVTARNFRTVLKLDEMARELAG